jgi:sigma-B regulation protein RsbU (phosphoserine phosphatase)
LAVGIDSGDVFERVTKDMELTIEPGDCILLHTDGVKEALNKQEDEYGIARMKDSFLQSPNMGAEAVLSNIQRSLKEFTGEAAQMDDITLVAIEKR